MVTVSGTTLIGAAAAGGGAGAEEAIVADAPTLGAATAAATGAERRLAAQPSLPRNWIDGRLANLAAVDDIMVFDWEEAQGYIDGGNRGKSEKSEIWWWAGQTICNNITTKPTKNGQWDSRRRSARFDSSLLLPSKVTSPGTRHPA